MANPIRMRDAPFLEATPPTERENKESLQSLQAPFCKYSLHHADCHQPLRDLAPCVFNHPRALHWLLRQSRRQPHASTSAQVPCERMDGRSVRVLHLTHLEVNGLHHRAVDLVLDDLVSAVPPSPALGVAEHGVAWRLLVGFVGSAV